MFAPSTTDQGPAAPLNVVGGCVVLAMPATSYRALGKNHYLQDSVTAAVGVVLELNQAASSDMALSKPRTREALLALIGRGFIGGTSVDVGVGTTIVQGTRRMTIRIPQALFEAATSRDRTLISAA